MLLEGIGDGGFGKKRRRAANSARLCGVLCEWRRGERGLDEIGGILVVRQHVAGDSPEQLLLVVSGRSRHAGVAVVFGRLDWVVPGMGMGPRCGPVVGGSHVVARVRWVAGGQGSVAIAVT